MSHPSQLAESKRYKEDYITDQKWEENEFDSQLCSNI